MKILAVVNTYALNIRAPKYIKQILMDAKGKIDNIIIIVREFNTPVSAIDRSSRQKKSTRK